MDERIILTGNLSEIRLPTLLMSLYRDRETGLLALSDGSFTKTLFIRKGVVVYATSTNPDERLGECLLRRGAISVPQYLESVAMLNRGRRQGEILLDMGALPPEGLVESVTQQLYDIVFSLFDIRSGTYTLELTPFSTVELITLSLEIPHMVFRGMERLDAWGPMFQAVGEPSGRIRAAAEMPPFAHTLELTPEQEHVLGLCKAGMSVANILEASYLPNFQTYRLLWVLLTLGVVVREREGRAPAEEAETPDALLERYNDLFLYVHHGMSAGEQGAQELKRALEEAIRPHSEFAGGLSDLWSYGRLDLDAVLWSLRAMPEDERVSRLRAFLEEVLYAMVFAADRALPQDDRDRLHAYIRARTQPAPGGE